MSSAEGIEQCQIPAGEFYQTLYQPYEEEDREVENFMNTGLRLVLEVDTNEGKPKEMQ